MHGLSLRGAETRSGIFKFTLRKLPKEPGKVNSDKTLISVTNEKIKTDEPELGQFEKKHGSSCLLKEKARPSFIMTGNLETSR